MPRKAAFVLSITVLLLVVHLSAAQSLRTDIAVPGNPFGIAVNPLTNKVYVALSNVEGSVDALGIIDGKTNALVDTVLVPRGPSQLAVNPVSGRVYVAGCDFDTFPVECGLTMVDGSTHDVISTLKFIRDEGVNLQGIAVNPITERVYISEINHSTVEVVDGKTNTPVAEVVLGVGNEEPIGIAVDFVRNLVLVANGG